MLRLLILALFVYFVLRLIRRLLLRPASKARGGWQAPSGGPARPPPKVIDEMKPCPACGTFNPTRLAYEKKGLYFCDQRCHEAYIRGKSPA
ncbi:MAG: hypothetical protein U1F66_06995 [bacterium]